MILKLVSCFIISHIWGHMYFCQSIITFVQTSFLDIYHYCWTKLLKIKQSRPFLFLKFLILWLSGRSHTKYLLYMARTSGRSALICSSASLRLVSICHILWVTFCDTTLMITQHWGSHSEVCSRNLTLADYIKKVNLTGSGLWYPFKFILEFWIGYWSF